MLFAALMIAGLLQNNLVVKAADSLSYWNDDARAKNELQTFMKDITNSSSENYIPVEDRIAVFDLDGTLFCETDSVYLDHLLLVYRVYGDPSYVNKATEAEKAAANKVLEFAETGVYPNGLDVEHGKAIASSFSGMTVDEFTAYVNAFGNTPANGYTGMNKGDAFYKPMVQVIDYLQANDFKVYIVSGTDRLILRGLVQGRLPIPSNQIIGSDETIVATNQGNTDGLDYVYTENDSLILGGDFIVKNLKMNKVAVIAQEIGKQPVLSFGNSSGDYSMAEYVTSHNKYQSRAFMLCCDDTVRENGKLSSAEKMYDACEKYGWVPISMKNDWETIYGDGVVRAQ